MSETHDKTVKMPRPLHSRPSENKAGSIAVDDRGRNVWRWNDPETNQAGTTTLIRKLDNNELSMADTQMWKREQVRKKARPKPKVKPGLSLADSPGSSPAGNRARSEQNRFGKKTDDGGGFNPYG